MSNYKFELFIDAKDIYNKLLPEQREKINNIKITDVRLCNNSTLYIECLAFEEEIKELPISQKLIGNWYVRAF